MNKYKYINGMLFLAAFLLFASCKDSTTSAIQEKDVDGINPIISSSDNNQTQNLYISNASVDTWDPILPATADPNWPNTVCYQGNTFGINANWSNPHKAFEVANANGSPHPWENNAGYAWDAKWINSYNSISSNASGGPGGHNWSKYETEVIGNGEFVVQLLADNCSWVYLDNQLIGYQGVGDESDPTKGKYGVTLDGTHTLSFVIFDGGGAAGGKFRLETTESFGDPPPALIEPVNQAPVADAGANQSLNATNPLTSVTLDGSASSDPDGNALSYSWSLAGSEIATGASPSVQLGLGVHTITLTVADPLGDTDSDEVVVEVINNPPVANAGADQTTEATGVLTTVGLDGTGSSDPNGDAISYSWSIGGSEVATGVAPSISVGVGSHTVSLTVTDEHGATATDEVVVNIVDTTAPELSYNVLDTSLWPPNHKMRLVVSGISVADIADPNAAVDIIVTSNEAINGQGDGNTDADWEVQGGNVYVRAERSGKGDGRVYTITITGSDASGNVTTETVEVTVPHNKGKDKNK